MRLLYIGAFCCLISPAWADNGARCAGLFTDPSASATCVTILNMNSQEYSDDALRDKISQMAYGVSYAEMEARRAKQEAEAQEAAAAEEARLLKHDQCHRLFVDLEERKACKTLRMLSMSRRSDVQMVAEVRQRLGKAPVSDDERLAIAQAESEYKKSAAAIAHAEAEKQKAEERQCQRLYRAEEERTACDTLRMISMRKRSDDQMREEVAQRVAQLRKEKADQERVQQKAQQARIAAAAGRDAKLRQGKTGFEMLQWELGGFGTIMQVRFILQNNTASSQKDFVIRCDTYGESGTQLSAVQKTLYQSLVPRARRSFDLSLGFVNSQSARASCGVVKSAPG
jgi:hypothetical protein